MGRKAPGERADSWMACAAGSAAAFLCGWVRLSVHTLLSQAPLVVRLLPAKCCCSACVGKATQRDALVQVLFGSAATGRRQA